MRFYRALGYVQIAGDFRVVTSLKKERDNLALPWADWLEVLFHKMLPPGRHAGRSKWR
jgi:hypothetical protein